jgi:hypothetical protein
MGHRLIEMTGKIFGQWTVIRRSENKKSRRWLCVCVCGTEKEIAGKRLRNGKDHTCPCSNYENLAGKKFGKLTALEVVRKRGKHGVYWKCACECGSSKIVYGGHLIASSTRSCGCLVLENIHESAKKTLYCRYRNKAKKRNIVFDISRKFFDELTSRDCFYCGKEPSQDLKNTTNRIAGSYSGIDRFDNSKPYTEENCVPCCNTCNIMKYTLSLESWIEHIKKVLSRWEQSFLRF